MARLGGTRIGIAVPSHRILKTVELQWRRRSRSPLLTRGLAGLRGDINEDDPLDALRMLRRVEEGVPAAH